MAPLPANKKNMGPPRLMSIKRKRLKAITTKRLAIIRNRQSHLTKNMGAEAMLSTPKAEEVGTKTRPIAVPEETTMEAPRALVGTKGAPTISHIRLLNMGKKWLKYTLTQLSNNLEPPNQIIEEEAAIKEMAMGGVATRSPMVASREVIMIKAHPMKGPQEEEENTAMVDIANEPLSKKDHHKRL
jgi:hypothetical protein